MNPVKYQISDTGLTLVDGQVWREMCEPVSERVGLEVRNRVRNTFIGVILGEISEQ